MTGGRGRDPGPGGGAGAGRGPDGPRSGSRSRAPASPARLEAHVRRLEGERHPTTSPEALEAAFRYVEGELRQEGYRPRRDAFVFQGAEHVNVVAEKPGSDPSAPRVLVGAHVDTIRGTPGADDNASGVAVLLEVARHLADEALEATVELVAFNLEEQQGLTYRVGSRHHAARARETGVRYAGALVLEMVGYTDARPGSQRVPRLISWTGIPRTGDFLAAVGDGQSGRLLRHFRAVARETAPGLRVVTHRTPFRGWLVWQTRLSDNASFWSEGYPALMITDTAFLRNPNYHRASDVAGSLDYAFMARVVEVTAAAVRSLAGSGPAGGRTGARVGGPPTGPARS